MCHTFYVDYKHKPKRDKLQPQDQWSQLGQFLHSHTQNVKHCLETVWGVTAGGKGMLLASSG